MASVSVACVMVSPAGPLARVKEAIRAFTEQTFAPRTLTIALCPDAPQLGAIERYLASMPEEIETGRIRLQVSPQPSIDDLIEETTADLVCEWSSDVHQHATRLAVQIPLMRSLGAHASVFADWIWWHAPAREIFWCDTWSADDGARMPGIEASLIATRESYRAHRDRLAQADAPADLARLTDAGPLMVSRIDASTLPSCVPAHAKSVAYVRQHRQLLRGLLPALRLSRPYLLQARHETGELVALDPLDED